MKCLLHIINLHILLLTFWPCQDGITTCQVTNQYITEASHEEQEENDNDCSPLCVCICCGIAVTKIDQEINIKPINHVSQVVNEFCNYFIDFPFSPTIWRPPQGLN